MLTRRFIFQLPIRNYSSKSAASTEVVLLHFGQPWNEFYAKEFLSNRAALFYNLPDFVKNLVPKNLLSNDKIRGCIEAYGERPSLEVQVDTLAETLEKSLATMVPEYGPFKVTRLFHFDDKSIAERFEQIKLNRSKKFIFVPLYPHFIGADGGKLLSQIAENINETTVPFVENNREVTKRRVEQRSDYSFDVSSIHRWNDHPILSEYWARRIEKELPKLKGLVFAVPRKFGCSRQDFDRSVWATCERVMTRLAHSVPYRVGFYNSWDSWDLPCQNSVASQVKKFGGISETEKVGIVPITEIFETFDTICVLPHLTKQIANAVLIQPEEGSEKLSQGMAELLKNHLLGRPHRQLEVSSENCNRKDRQNLSLFF